MTEMGEEMEMEVEAEEHGWSGAILKKENRQGSVRDLI